QAEDRPQVGHLVLVRRQAVVRGEQVRRVAHADRGLAALHRDRVADAAAGHDVVGQALDVLAVQVEQRGRDDEPRAADRSGRHGLLPGGGLVGRGRRAGRRQQARREQRACNESLLQVEHHFLLGMSLASRNVAPPAPSAGSERDRAVSSVRAVAGYPARTAPAAPTNASSGVDGLTGLAPSGLTNWRFDAKAAPFVVSTACGAARNDADDAAKRGVESIGPKTSFRVACPYGAIHPEPIAARRSPVLPARCLWRTPSPRSPARCCASSRSTASRRATGCRPSATSRRSWT